MTKKEAEEFAAQYKDAKVIPYEDEWAVEFVAPYSASFEIPEQN